MLVVNPESLTTKPNHYLTEYIIGFDIDNRPILMNSNELYAIYNEIQMRKTEKNGKNKKLFFSFFKVGANS